MIRFDSMEKMIKIAKQRKVKLWDVVLQEEMETTGQPLEFLIEKMRIRLSAMQRSVDVGIKHVRRSKSGLSGDQAATLSSAIEQGGSLAGKIVDSLLIKSIAVSEQNACMGRIVAAPTAGSCGILPAVLLTFMEHKRLDEEKVVKALFTAAGIGAVIGARAGLSGAEYGCQAECGSAAAMAAGALTDLLEGTPDMVEHACAIAMKNVLGLICDPVAGLVEVPCVKRNASGAMNALTAAQLALAGIQSTIPADETIDAMRQVGEAMPMAFKETAMGGLAATPTGMSIKARLDENRK